MKILSKLNIPLLKFLHSGCTTSIRHAAAKNHKQRMARDEYMSETVYKYAGINAKRAQRIYVWGYAAVGATGVRQFLKPEKSRRPRSMQLNPHRHQFLDNVTAGSAKVIDIACGYGYTIFLVNIKNAHVVFGTGVNTDSQLGYQMWPPKSGRILDYVIEPAPISLPSVSPSEIELKRVKCGRAHTVILSSEGIFTLGNNARGQCGRAMVDGEIFHGSQVIHKIKSLPDDVVDVECGQDHTLLLCNSGELYTCGLGADGQTGLGHFSAVGIPSLVTGDIRGEKIVHVSSRVDCTLAVSDKGDVFGFGNSEYNQLASISSSSTQICVPKRLPFTSVGHIVKVAAAGSMCALLNDKGEVYVWGYGILGAGPNALELPAPTLLPPPLFAQNEFNPKRKVVDIQCGIHHFMALTNDGDLYVWGKNATGVLGLGRNKDQYFPFKALIPAEVMKVACGVDHTFAICRSFS